MASPQTGATSRRTSGTNRGCEVIIGISQFAVDELTDITYLEIRRKSGPIKAGEAFGEIESVKATSELYAGIGGTVTAFNQAAIDNPGHHQRGSVRPRLAHPGQTGRSSAARPAHGRVRLRPAASLIIKDGRGGGR